MDKMTKKWIWVLFIAATACSYQKNYDPFDPRLPQYTEAGQNIGAAILNDRSLWTIKNNCQPNFTTACSDNFGIEAFPDLNRQAWYFKGNAIAGDYDGQELYFRIILPETTSKQAIDLILLEGSAFDFGQNAQLQLLNSNGQVIGQASEGKLFIRKVLPRANGTLILAGTFGFTGTLNGEAITLSSGRFDFALVERFHFLLK